jgi:hypothetical protein
MLQACSRTIRPPFLQSNALANAYLDYGKLFPDVVTITDEVDAQLKQLMLHYMEANAIGTKPHTQPVK